MERTKRYTSVRFPYSVIASAYAKFRRYCGTKSGKPTYVEWTLGFVDRSESSYDSEKQFQLDYMSRDDIQEARVKYSYSTGDFLFLSTASQRQDSPDSRISISLRNPASIEKVFAEFDAYYSQNPQNPEIKTKNRVIETSYKATTKLPSVFLEKQPLHALEQYIIRHAEPYRPRSQPIDELYSVRIVDSSGSMYLDTIDLYPHELFDNGIERISLSYGLYGSPLEVSLVFSKRADATEMEISYKGESAKEVVEGLKMGILNQLKDLRTWDWIYHPSFPISMFLWGVFIFAISLELTILAADHKFSQPFSSAILLLGTYLFVAPRLKPYIAFDTRYNQSARRWSRWLVEFILTLLLAWMLYAVFGIHTP